MSAPTSHTTQTRTTHEVVAPRREALHHRHLVPPRARARAGLAPAEVPHEAERAGPHDGEVEDERDDHAEGGPEVVQDVVPLVREEHDDRVEQAERREGRDQREEARREERARGEGEEERSGEEACAEGDPEVLSRRSARHSEGRGTVCTHDEHRNGDVPVGNPDIRPSAAHDVDEPHRIRGIQRDLEYAIQHDEDGAVLCVSARELVPDHDHRDAAREADHDHARAVRREVGQRRPREREHRERAEHPVEQEREEDVCQCSAGEEQTGQRFVVHFGQDGPHHDDQPDGDRWVGM